MEAEVLKLQQKVPQTAKAMKALDVQKNEAHNRRQDARRREDELKTQKAFLRDALGKLERQVRLFWWLGGCTDNLVYLPVSAHAQHSLLQVEPGGYEKQQALALAKKLSRDYNICVHGTVLELVGCIHALHTAVEVGQRTALCLSS